MFRYNTQVASLVGMLGVSAIVALLRVTEGLSPWPSASVGRAAALFAAYVWAPALVGQVIADLEPFPSRPDAHGGARGAAAVPLHGQLALASTVDVFPQRLLPRRARRDCAGCQHLALSPSRSLADRDLHRGGVHRHHRPEPVRLLPGAGHRGGDRLAVGARARLGRGAARRQSQAHSPGRDAAAARSRGHPGRGPRDRAEPRARCADHHARGRHARLLGERHGVVAVIDAGTVWLRRALHRALRRDQSRSRATR